MVTVQVDHLSGIEKVDKIYSIVQSTDVDAELRSSAAAAFGALNLPSQKVKDLILNQAKI